MQTDSFPPPTGYADLSPLGRGTYGAVYRAVHAALGRPVALKLLHADRPLADRARLVAEAQAIAGIRHPHVVQVFDVGDQEGRPFLAMELLSGGTLADMLKSIGLFPRDAADLVRKIALGVQAAHAQGIIHRDLKPENVLFDEHGEPKVVDFGLAKRLSGEAAVRTLDGAVTGTPAYLAPEQLKGAGVFVGPPADVWALGGILYECMTGKRAFEAGNVFALLRKVAEAAPTPPRKVNGDIPRDLEMVCLKCLSKDPRDRYQTAGELAEDLDRFHKGRPVAARPIKPVVRFMKWSKRNKVATALIVVLILGAAGTAAGLIRSAREREARLRQIYADGMRQSLQRGDVHQALENFDEAERLGLPVSTSMRLDRARALVMIGEGGRARQSLESIPEKEVGAADRGRYELLRGELLLIDNDAAARELIRRSLDADRELSSAEQHYARGLLEQDPKKALAEFELAAEADGMFQPARLAIAFYSAMVFDLDKALRTSEESLRIWPGHPDFLGMAVIAHGLKGHEGEAQRLLGVLRPLVNDEYFAVLQYVARWLPQIKPSFLAIVFQDPRHVGKARQLDLDGGIENAPQTLQPIVDNVTKGQFSSPFAAKFTLWIQDYLSLVAEGNGYVGTDVPDDKFRAWQAQINKYNECFLTYLSGLILLFRGNTHSHEGGDHRKLEIAFREAASLFESAARQPALLDFKEMALFGAAMTRGMLGRDNHKPAPLVEEARKGADSLRELVRLKEAPAMHWKTYVLIAKNGHEWTLARELLDRWPESKDTLDYWSLRSQIELLAGSPSTSMEASWQVIRLADVALSKNPSDAGARMSRTQAVERLDKAAKQLADRTILAKQRLLSATLIESLIVTFRNMSIRQ